MSTLTWKQLWLQLLISVSVCVFHSSCVWITKESWLWERAARHQLWDHTAVALSLGRQHSTLGGWRSPCLNSGQSGDWVYVIVCCVLWGTEMPSWVCWRALGWSVEISSLWLQRPRMEKRQVPKLLLATTGLFMTLCKEGHPKAFCWKKCLLFLLVKQSQTNSEQVFTFWAFNAKTLCHAWEKCWPRGALPWSN